MDTQSQSRNFARTMLVWASIVIVVAGTRVAAPLVIPLLLALFLAILCGPPLTWLIRHGIRQSLAMVLVLAGLCFVVLILAQVLATTAREFVAQWPTVYLPKAEQLVNDWNRWVEERTDRLLPAEESSEAPPPAESQDDGLPGPAPPAVPEKQAAPDASTPQSTTSSNAADRDTVIEGTTLTIEARSPLQPTFPSEPDGSLLHDLDATQPEHHKTNWHDWIKPGFVMQSFTIGVRALSGILSQAVLILITTIFLMVEATTLPKKLHAISSDAPARLEKLRHIAQEVNHYMAIKTSTSLLTGGVVALSLWLLNVDFAPLWGLTAFLLNFVPNIGSIIAAVPAIVLALLQHDPLKAALVTGVYVAINMFVGYYLEPKWMGRGLGLSTLVVFCCLVFWGWVLGPVGMVISVPLTMALKIVLEGSPETRWLAILMGPGGEDAVGT